MGAQIYHVWHDYSLDRLNLVRAYYEQQFREGFPTDLNPALSVEDTGSSTWSLCLTITPAGYMGMVGPSLVVSLVVKLARDLAENPELFNGTKRSRAGKPRSRLSGSAKISAAD